MSSVYGPALLKPASFEENTEFAGGRSKANRDNGTDFETDADRAKRIRKERKALKQKDKETSLKSSMGQAISGVLGGGGGSAGPFVSFGAAPAGPAPPPSAGANIGPMRPAPGPSVPEGVKIGGGNHTPSVPSQPATEAPATAAAAATAATAAGPSTGPAASPAGGNGQNQDPSRTMEDAVAEEPAGGSTGPVPRPRGPAKPPPEALPRPPPRQGQKPEEPSPQAEAFAAMPLDHLATQKRVSWDELKERLANVEMRQEGVPGSKSFEDYSERLEKSRNERLQRQENDTKKLLRRSAELSEKKMKKLAKKMKEKSGGGGPKRTSDGAILAVSDGETSEEDALVARYKNQKKAAKTSGGN
mmetsp:Transcript_104875/g.208460  ORF Transcript_104875/g.208460 Transcript_104875/m.208460 type:complete len:359 (+) Transcript_104875:87-1163(+)